MVDRLTIEHWRNAPRLTSFAAFFERTASGQGGAPDLAEPQIDMSSEDGNVDGGSGRPADIGDDDLLLVAEDVSKQFSRPDFPWGLGAAKASFGLSDVSMGDRGRQCTGSGRLVQMDNLEKTMARLKLRGCPATAFKDQRNDDQTLSCDKGGYRYHLLPVFLPKGPFLEQYGGAKRKIGFGKPPTPQLP